MSNNAFDNIQDKELMKLFKISSFRKITMRAKQVIAELERRGYFYDAAFRDFLTCDQWNIRYPNKLKDCEDRSKWLKT